jgi:NADPH-dependent 2,4-dienoyl-CoA reductase/sulfur reductase-like enzyme
VHYVVLGNGIAGMEAAIALRARDDGARITVVSAESDHLFSRTALMYIFCGQLSLRDTEPHDRGLYERLRFERVRKRVVAVDPAAHQLRFEDRSELRYDRLLLAVGSRARPAPWPGSDGPGVHSFVTLDDLARLDQHAKAGMRAAVIGGGLIGVETAEILHLRGLHTTFVIREPWYFPVALDRREATAVARHMASHGVDVRLDSGVEQVLRGPDGAVRGLRLAGGEELPVDLVVVAIGVVPNTGFLAESGLPLSRGGSIETDPSLAVTGVPDVWAAGDCATVTWVDGSRRPEQLWYTARDQGRAAAAAMLGDDSTYRRGAWYNSAKFFDVEYTTAGWIPVPEPGKEQAHPPGSGWQTWYQEQASACITQRLVARDGLFKGFNGLGTRWDHTVLLGWIQQRRTLSWVIDHLDQARFDEEFMPAFRVLPSATLTEGA